MKRLISLDTETTGIDFYHGAMPFFVTTCDEDDVVTFWEWDVDPLTRKPLIPKADLEAIGELVACKDNWLVLQNTKFDVKSLSTVLPDTARNWPWERTHDTLICGHVLASNYPHDLTSMGRQYLGVDISHLEKQLKEATVKARAVARSNFPDWQIAAAGRPDMPSASGESPTGFDMWLPRAIVKARWESSDSYKNYVRGGKNYVNMPGWEFHPPQISPIKDKTPPHPWWTLLRDYSNADSVITINLWKEQSAQLQKRKLVRIYEERVKVLKIAYDMETTGITISGERLELQTAQYLNESQNLKSVCENIASGMGYKVELPRSGANKSVTEFVFNGLKLPPVKVSGKTGAPSLDKEVLEYYEQTLEPRSKAHTFIRSLRAKRKRDTALQYMQGYKRFWLPLDNQSDWWVLHPSLNPTGTATLRWSCANPNEQNISKQEGFNLRESFGPPPGWEWYSLDARNIELRIPAYKAPEQAMIDLFEKPNDPPYYGSNHLLNFHIIYPDIWEAVEREVGFEKVGPTCKKKYASTWYQYCKNGGFAVQYGAIDRADGTGTADRAFHRPGCHAKLKTRFSNMEALNQRCIHQARTLGYVETVPDITVDPDRGYPLMCTQTNRGDVLPTVPLNYYVQGTAMWWMQKAMIRTYAQLQEWKHQGFPCQMVMQVHDELVFAMPKSKVHPQKSIRQSNLWRVHILRDLMEQGGKDIGVPTPVGIEYHECNWGIGISL